MSKHNPGRWTVGKGSYVISDEPPVEPGQLKGADDVEHYGGYLICESVSPANARLIALAPKMLEQLKWSHDVLLSRGLAGGITDATIKEIRALVAELESE